MEANGVVIVLCGELRSFNRERLLKVKNPLMVNIMGKDGLWDYVQDSDSGSRATTEDLNTESEVLQKVTDYSTEGQSEKVLLSLSHFFMILTCPTMT